MKQLSRILVLILIFAVLLTACSKGDTTKDDQKQNEPQTNTDANKEDKNNDKNTDDKPDTSGLPVSSKDTLVIAHQSDSIDLDMHGSTTNATIKIKGQVYEPLIELTVDNELLPLLATSWEYIDDHGTLQILSLIHI